jgi:ElaB/YqjD/DUF883 family membrane-anchored ribosome-binding protein
MVKYVMRIEAMAASPLMKPPASGYVYCVGVIPTDRRTPMRVSGRGVSANKDLVREVNALKARLKKVSATMEAVAGEGASRTLDTIESKGKQMVDGVIEAAQNFIDEYGDAAGDRMNALARRSAELRANVAKSLAETVQQRPLGTLAVIAGIGFLAGYVCRRH